MTLKFNTKPEGLSAGQSIFLASIVGISLGVVGLFSLALMVWFSHQRFGVDRSDKHGISVRNTSRLGGLVIFLFLTALWALSLLFDDEELALFLIVPLDDLPIYVWPTLATAFIGFADDIGFEIKPLVRLAMVYLVVAPLLLIEPSLLPNRLLEATGLEGIWISLVFCATSGLLLVGFVNAANIADGANGLLSGICLAFFWVYWRLDGDGWSFYLLVALFCFWLINVFSGRIMLDNTVWSASCFFAFDL